MALAFSGIFVDVLGYVLEKKNYVTVLLVT